MDAKKILVIDDDPSICKIVIKMLTQAGYEVFAASSGKEGLRQLYSVQPDLVLLDILMPEMDGLEVLKRIRELTDIPVIVLSAVTQMDVTVRSLEMGADDYLKKPFAREELFARIGSVLRRTTTSTLPVQRYQDGYLAIDLQENRVLVEGKPVRLTVTEYKILEYLYLHGGKVCTYSWILENVWGNVARNGPHYIHVYIQKLRHKIEKDPNNPIYVLTEYGVGYRFERQKN